MWDSTSQLLEEAFKKTLNGSQASPDTAFSVAPSSRPYKANITYALLKTAQENPDTAGNSDCLYHCNGLVERDVSYGAADPFSQVKL